MPPEATDTSALLHAWVNPQGLPATATFEWGTTSDFGQRSTPLAGPARTFAADVQLPLTGLTPGTRYYWRVVVTSDAGTTVVGGKYVDTTAAPTVTADAATKVSATAAILNGRVHPHSLDATAWFEWAPLGGAGGKRTPDVLLPAATWTRTTSATVTGLTPATTYTYRVVARNSSGETASDGVTFRTPS